MGQKKGKMISFLDQFYIKIPKRPHFCVCNWILRFSGVKIVIFIIHQGKIM